jgi:uncharacterized protein
MIMSEEKTVNAEVVENLTSDDKLWGMLSHLLVFCTMLGIPFGNILAPLIIMLTQKDKSQYVVDNAKESLNFQIAYTIYGFAVGILCFLIIGLLALPVLAIAWVVFPIIAGLKANDGIKYQYPYIFRLIK